VVGRVKQGHLQVRQAQQIKVSRAVIEAQRPIMAAVVVALVKPEIQAGNVSGVTAWLRASAVRRFITRAAVVAHKTETHRPAVEMVAAATAGRREQTEPQTVAVVAAEVAGRIVKRETAGRAS